MRPATTALKALIDNWSPNDRIGLVDLYTITLATGEVFRLSGTQIALSAPAPNTASPLVDFPLGPAIDRTKSSIKIGVEVDELEVHVYAGPSDMLGINAQSITWQRAAWAGLFDGAYLELWRGFVRYTAPGDFPTVAGTIVWFYGRIADVEVGRSDVKIHVKSELDRLTVQMPRRLYQSSCTFVFGDAMCTFDRSTRAANVTCTGASNATVIGTTLSPTPATLYDNGTIVSTSGANNGFSRTIRLLTGGQVFLFKPWIFPVAAGSDTFQLLPGCDHTFDGGCTTFFGADAPLHFGGFRFIPPPENAI